MLSLRMNGGWWPKAARLVGCFLLFACSFRSDAQNLVPNPSFEEYEVCPYTIGFQPGNRPTHWRSWLNSPEYFHACAQPINGMDTLVGVPWNGWSFQYAFDGEAYVGLMTYGNSVVFREYVGVQLNEAMIPGQSYCASFRVNLAMDGSYWPARWASNNIGMLFTMASNAWSGLTGPPFPFRNYAHVYSDLIITDTVGWVLVSGSFVADSAYQYLALGNFFADTLTDTLAVQAGISAGAYYLIDAVCVSPGTKGCAMTGMSEGQLDATPRVWPVPTIGPFTVHWPQHANFRLQLFDALGRNLIEYMAQGESIEVEVGGHGPGVYLVRLSKGEAVFIERIVVQY